MRWRPNSARRSGSSARAPYVVSCRRPMLVAVWSAAGFDHLGAGDRGPKDRRTHRDRLPVHVDRRVGAPRWRGARDRGLTDGGPGGGAHRRPLGRGRSAQTQSRTPHRPRVRLGTGAGRVPDRERPHRARPLLPAHQPGLRRPLRRASAADRDEPRRTDGRDERRPQPRCAVLDQPRLRRRRRQLRRQHRLRPRLPRTAERQLGRGRRRRLQRRRGTLPGGEGKVDGKGW